MLMIDIKLIRESPDIVKENIKKKFQNEKLPLVDEIKKKDELWRELKSQTDNLRHERNKVSIEISQSKKQGESVSPLLKKAKSIPDKIAKTEVKSKKLWLEIQEMMLQIPNIISKHTPIGKDEKGNKVVKTVGRIPSFKFPIKNHVELSEALDIVDFDSSARVSGNGFYYLKGDLALLNQALIRFTIDHMQKKRLSIY